MARFKHELLTERIIDLIERGELKAGEKLPSLRTLCRQQGISLMTAYQAFNTLEGLGFVESRARSGYYARNPLRKSRFKKHYSKYKKLNAKSLDEMIQMVYGRELNKSVVSLSLNSPEVSLLPETKFKKSLLFVNRYRSGSSLLYGPFAGLPALKEQIAVLSVHSGMDIHSDDLIITAGSMEAINLAISACTEAGDKILIESPSYFGNFQTIVSLGRKPVEVETDFNTGIVIESMEKAIEEHQPKACVLVSSYSNPLGATIPNESKKKIVNLLAKYNITLIENDIYGELYYSSQRSRSCKSYDENNNVIYCSSFSKSLAPGYRIGWIHPGKFYDKVFQAKVSHSVTTSTLTQEILAHFLKHGRYDLHLKRMRKQLHTQSLKYQQAIENYFPKDTVVSKPKGGFVLWVELNNKVDTLTLFKKAMAENISFAPGQMFSMEKDLHNYFRISIGQPYGRKIEAAIKKLGDLIKEEIIA
ncbi:PLP-dependent aminotransferase family protein [Chondrinema litorale]|uniref:aminotransferase-like domain-containing protein n=1 Tax=Chondrinema litorale TaxID=2994555 RepID=UPI0025427910|nr:PLP-dependent aminotransferase family protein [Chondrinema litorale]UZR99381.1 PLP-dependent aminotransferase family protein [Chondrinema litorale]